MSFITDAEIVLSALDAYFQQLVTGEGPVITQPPLSKLVSELDLENLVRTGTLSGERLKSFIHKYLATTTRLNHPGYLAHQSAAPHYAGAIAALIDGFTNNPMAIYEMGPGAASIEYFIINWMLSKVGWQPAPLPPLAAPVDQAYGGGVLTHGGSLANLTALIAARSHAVPGFWEQGNPGNLALLVSPENHYSIARSAGIMGLGPKAIYTMEVDKQGVIIPEKLPAAYDRLRSDGKKAIALVANACSTAAGLYDPLEAIGNFCREHDLWLHVDGAHGACALLSERFKHLLSGVELADSLIWDAHKMLRTPSLCTAVLVRDAGTLDRAFQQEASYLFHEKEEPGFDFIHRTVECTKAGLGLRLFMTLAALGEQGMASYVERQFDLATEAYEFLSQTPGFECGVRPQANILCFRVPGSDERQLAIRDRLISQGDFHLSTSEYGGKRYLRLTFMSPYTTLADIERLVARIKEIM